MAQYSRPAYQQQEQFTEDNELELSESVPGLSLKFAMPPVAHVRFLFYFKLQHICHVEDLHPSSTTSSLLSHQTNLHLSLPPGSAPQQTTDPTLNARSKSPTARRPWRSVSKAV